MSLKLMDRKSDQLKWLYNVKSFERPDDVESQEYPEDGGAAVMLFDENLRSDNDMVYYMFGDSGEESFTYEDCKKVFRNQPEENLVYMKDCGHFLMDQQPEDTTKNVEKFINDIDKKIQK